MTMPHAQYPGERVKKNSGWQYFLLCVVRNLLISRDGYGAMHEAIDSAVPSGIEIEYNPLERTSVVYLSRLSINRAAHRSRRFRQRTPEKLSHDLLEVAPATKDEQLTVGSGDAFVVEGDLSILALAVKPPDTFFEEQDPILDWVAKESCTPIQPHVDFPFVAIARFRQGEVPASAIDALEEAKPKLLKFDRLQVVPAIPDQRRPILF